MKLTDLFKSDIDRFGQSVPKPAATDERSAAATQSSAHVAARLPRGADVIRDKIDRKEQARFARGNEIADIAWQPGHVMLGKFNGRYLGDGSDKPIVTIASARSGKTATVLLPALYTYPGSVLALDPKGELARETAKHRRDVLGQNVYVLDPFGCSSEPPAAFNPLAELDPASATLVDDVDNIAQALILAEDSSADGSHWTNSAQALVRGLILHALQKSEAERNLVTVRQLLMLTYPPLVVLQAQLQAQGTKDPAEAVQNALFLEMANGGTVFGGALAGSGTSFLRKNTRERSSIISTAETQLRFLDSEPLQATLTRSDFKLDALRDRPTTIYLCLPSGQIDKHSRWLRLVVRLALMALERRGTYPRGKSPILFLMEEFAVLGHLPVMEQAAAYFPGYGVKLHCVLQDISQLQRHYRASWHTFLGNSGVIQMFGVNDKATLDYASDRLGSLSFVRGTFGSPGKHDDPSKNYVDKERLAYPHEIAAAFSRGTGAQLLLCEGRPPMAVERLSFDDVAAVKDMAPTMLKS